MIKLKNIPSPPFLQSAEVNKAIDTARKAAKNNTKISVPDLWGKDNDTRNKLHERHYQGKCCYCERRRDISYDRDVEHYRPKKGVDGVKHKGYWWLAYNWDNLLIACPTCNRKYKKNFFPLIDEKKRVYKEGDILLEEPYIFNPAIENPEPHFSYHYDKAGGKWYATILHVQGDAAAARATETIRLLGLNRDELTEETERAECITLLLQLIAEFEGWLAFRERTIGSAKNQKMAEEKIKKVIDDIKIQVSFEKTYSGFRRYIARTYGLRRVAEYIPELNLV